MLWEFLYSTIDNRKNIQNLIIHIPWFYMIIMIRLLKILTLLEEIKSLRIIT